MWIKVGTRTFQIFGHNVHHNRIDNDYELWVQTEGKKSTMISHGSEELMLTLYNAINFTIEHDKKLLEL